MRIGRVLGVLLLLNAVAVGFLLWRRGVAVGSAGFNLGSGVVTQIVHVPMPPEPIPDATQSTNAFYWNQLESEDYREYIARLRKIGCPEQTIRDLIIADIDKLYSGRVQNIYPRKSSLNYWESEDAELANNYDQREWQRREREIEREKERVIRELLGVDLAAERQRIRGQVDKLDRRLGFLPEAKRSELRQLLESWDDQEWAIREKAWERGGALSAQEIGQLRNLREQRETRLGQVLTSEEREKFDLWMSPTAEAVRHDFYGAQPTEEEFLSVYRVRKEFDEAWPRQEIDPTDETSLEAWGTALLQLEDQLKSTLGEDRFNMLERGQDQHFHQLNQTVSRFNLPREKAAEAYEYLRFSQMERNRVMENGAFSPTQQANLSQRIEIETQKALQELLGDGAFRYYDGLSRNVR